MIVTQLFLGGFLLISKCSALTLRSQTSSLIVGEDICERLFQLQLIKPSENDSPLIEVNEERLQHHFESFNASQWNAIAECLYVSDPAISNAHFSEISHPNIRKALVITEPLKYISPESLPSEKYVLDDNHMVKYVKKEGKYEISEHPIEWLAQFVSHEYPYIGILLARSMTSSPSLIMCNMIFKMHSYLNDLSGWIKESYHICHSKEYPLVYPPDSNIVEFARHGDFSRLGKNWLRPDLKKQISAAAILSGFIDFIETCFPGLGLKEEDFDEECSKLSGYPLRKSPLIVVDAVISGKILNINLRFVFEAAISNFDWRVTKRIMDFVDLIDSKAENDRTDRENSFITKLSKVEISDSSFRVLLKEGQDRIAKFYIQHHLNLCEDKINSIFMYGHDLQVIEKLLSNGLRPLRSFHYVNYFPKQSSFVNISLEVCSSINDFHCASFSAVFEAVHYDLHIRNMFDFAKFELFAKYNIFLDNDTITDLVGNLHLLDKRGRNRLISDVLSNDRANHSFQDRDMWINAVTHDEGDILKLAARLNSPNIPNNFIDLAIVHSNVKLLSTLFKLQLPGTFTITNDQEIKLLNNCRSLNISLSDKIKKMAKMALIPLPITKELIEFAAEYAILPFIRTGISLDPKVSPPKKVYKKMATYHHIEIWKFLVKNGIFPDQDTINAFAMNRVLCLVKLMASHDLYPDEETMNFVAANDDPLSVIKAMEKSKLPEDYDELINMLSKSPHLPTNLAFVRNESLLDCILRGKGSVAINKKIVEEAIKLDNDLIVKYAASMTKPILLKSKYFRNSEVSYFMKKNLADTLVRKGNFAAINRYYKDGVGVLSSFFSEDTLNTLKFIKSIKSIDCTKIINVTDELIRKSMIRENLVFLKFIFFKLEKPIFPSKDLFKKPLPFLKFKLERIVGEAIKTENEKVLRYFLELENPIFPAIELLGEPSTKLKFILESIVNEASVRKNTKILEFFASLKLPILPHQ